MNDLIERLRTAKGGSYELMVGGLCKEAADEIERLQRQDALHWRTRQSLLTRIERAERAAKDYAATIARSGYDVSPCQECGNPTVSAEKSFRVCSTCEAAEAAGEE